MNAGGGTRGEKRPGTPTTEPREAPARAKPQCSARKIGCAVMEAPEDTRSQKPRRRATRCFGGLPAINAPLMAPIDTPVTQSGEQPASVNPSNTPAWYAP